MSKTEVGHLPEVNGDDSSIFYNRAREIESASAEVAAALASLTSCEAVETVEALLLRRDALAFMREAYKLEQELRSSVKSALMYQRQGVTARESRRAEREARERDEALTWLVRAAEELHIQTEKAFPVGSRIDIILRQMRSGGRVEVVEQIEARDIGPYAGFIEWLAAESAALRERFDISEEELGERAKRLKAERTNLSLVIARGGRRAAQIPIGLLDG
jgi:hypothetical protein